MVMISLVKVRQFVDLSSFLFRIYHSKMGVSELMISDCDLFLRQSVQIVIFSILLLYIISLTGGSVCRWLC